MSVDAGTTENRLEEICPPHKMAVTDAMQAFQVSGVSGPCCTIRVSVGHAEGQLAAEVAIQGSRKHTAVILHARQAGQP